MARVPGGKWHRPQLPATAPVSRLLRNRPAYEERFGTDAYEAMLTGSLWGVYQMIGKLNPRLYVLTR
jgi:hypothetical protein